MTGAQRLAAYQVLLERVEGLQFETREEFFKRLSAAVRDAVPFDIVGAWVYDPADQMLRRGLLEGHESFGAAAAEIPVDFGPGGRVLQAQQRVMFRLQAMPAPPVATLLFDAGCRVACMVPV